MMGGKEGGEGEEGGEGGEFGVDGAEAGEGEGEGYHCFLGGFFGFFDYERGMIEERQTWRALRGRGRLWVSNESEHRRVD